MATSARRAARCTWRWIRLATCQQCRSPQPTSRITERLWWRRSSRGSLRIGGNRMSARLHWQARIHCGSASALSDAQAHHQTMQSARCQQHCLQTHGLADDRRKEFRVEASCGDAPLEEEVRIVRTVCSNVFAHVAQARRRIARPPTHAGGMCSCGTPRTANAREVHRLSGRCAGISCFG